MLQIDRTAKTLTPMLPTSFSEAGYQERYDLQALIKANPQPFFDELGEELLLIGEEVYAATDTIDNRIDLLAVDPEGGVAIIELKRGSNRYQLLQALAYAAMVNEWELQKLFDLRSKLASTDLDTARRDVESFVQSDLDSINTRQRVILLAEAFDYEVLATARWLSEGYGLDIRCYQMQLGKSESGECLGCTQVFPLRDLKDHAIQRSRRTAAADADQRWPDWDTAIASMVDPAQKSFFEQQVAAGREGQANRRMLTYRFDGKRRWWVVPSGTRCRVWQGGRFEGDVEFWKQNLASRDDIAVIDGGKALRFYLAIAEDYRLFLQRAESAQTDLNFIEA